ncbi:MAG: hypothetical protein WCY77_02700 [Weeksellaceae bacterium]
MNIKSLNKEMNKLSDKIIENGDCSFKLWLEFEETSPWNDLENDFANIIVDTLDGKLYGINVWTFKYLTVAQSEEQKEGNSNYIIPPDLFVKILTRDCIEETIKDLLSHGNLDEILNESSFGLNFLEPYWDALEMEENSIQSLINELKIELPENHVLYNESYELIARKTNNDDIILELDNGRIAVVHLTWKSKTEVDGYPITRIYENKIDFWNREMKQDIIEFKE